MPEVDWHFVVHIEASGSGSDAVVLGEPRGTAPSVPVSADLYVGDQVVRIDEAQIHAAEFPRPGSVAAMLHGRQRGTVPPGAVLRPAGSAPPDGPDHESAWVFGRRRQALGVSRTVEISPDYGGAMFRTSGGMAPVTAFSRVIPPELQTDLEHWYREWDESTTLNQMSEEEFVAQAHRLASRLRVALGSDEWDVFYRDG